jgi:hypothetical protein
MQPRTYQQIYDELGSIYDPQANLVRQQQQAIPGQIASEEAGLQAKQTQAYDDIVNGARRRGAGFSGIPLAEQAKYSATEYMPALARLRQSGQEQATSLEQAILGIQEKRANSAQQNYQYETTLAEQRRQFDEQIAQQRAEAARAAAASASPTFGFNPNLTGPKSASATAVQRADKGFNYFDANGRAISAAAYAAAKGLNFRDVLSAAAKAGDKGSQTALGFVGNDMGYDPRKVNSKQLADLYNALVWGTGKSASVAPAQAANPVKTILPLNANPLNLYNPLAIRR